MNLKLTGRQFRLYSFAAWALTAVFVVIAAVVAWMLEAAWIAASAFVLGKVIVVLAGIVLFRAWRRGRTKPTQASARAIS